MACITDYFSQYVPDQRAQTAMLLGAYLEAGTLCEPFPDQIGGGPGRGPFQIEAGAGGSRRGLISEAAARLAGPSVQHMAAEYLSCAHSVPNTGDVMGDYAGIVHCAEKGPMYPLARIKEAWDKVANAPKPGDPGYKYGSGCRGGIGYNVGGKEFCPFGTAGSPTDNPLPGGLPGSGIVGGVKSVGQFIGWILNAVTAPGFLVRALLIVGGAALTLMGLSKLTGIQAPQAVPIPV